MLVCSSPVQFLLYLFVMNIEEVVVSVCLSDLVLQALLYV